VILSLIASLTVALAADLPMGPERHPVPIPHFPDALHAYVWRNWELVPTERLADVVGAQPEHIRRMGRAMGLSGPPRVPEEKVQRLSTTVIRRNWHLLPYEQPSYWVVDDELAYHLR
jgi:hypothetical protein